MSAEKIPFVHERALCESPHVGTGTRVWAFAHVLPGARIGADCNICDHVFIENDVVLGDRVTVKCGVQIWDGIVVEDDVFIGPNVTFTNDVFPRSKQYPASFAKTQVRKGASIGANATILPGITIGSAAMIGAGAVVTRSVPPNAIVVGNPAKIVGYVDARAATSAVTIPDAGGGPSVMATSVAGVSLHTFKVVPDMRGSLTTGDFNSAIPFTPARYFMVFDVPSSEVRGEHAHKACHQFLIAVKGSVSVVADDGQNREEFLLDRNNTGLYLPPMVWGIQYRYSADAVLLVFASDTYDPDDYIRDYNDYLDFVSKG
ncbi:WxcM-like domain-containing protein [Alcaligenaceae bacterium]|nr:WxcM-like domain-containing protein [Alcaligenaceae bacterium]